MFCTLESGAHGVLPPYAGKVFIYQLLLQREASEVRMIGNPHPSHMIMVQPVSCNSELNFVPEKWNYIFFLIASQYIVKLRKMVPYFEIGPYFNLKLIPLSPLFY